MRKTIAFVLSLTLIITSFSAMPLYAAPIRVSEEARALATIGILEGDGGGVTSEYMEKRMDRITAAISILKLKGLYQESLKYTGRSNFADADEVKWKEGRNVLAYLKANPDLGFIGNEWGEFSPYKSIGEKEYYKVLLETLGYKQKTNGKSGDFSWDETLEFAESKGLKPSYKSDFNIDLLAKATVSALNTKTKAGKLFINILIDDRVITRTEAINAGLIREEIDIKIKSVRAIGNSVVEVEFEKGISSYDAENINNYSIDGGLSVRDAIFIGNNTVRLETSAQSSGKLYTLTSGKTKVKFAGVSKTSGSPTMKVVKSEDVGTIVVEFDKELDYYSATDLSNYYIAGIDINDAQISTRKVTLSAYGLTSRKQYTLKVTNIKSIDGVESRSQTKTFSHRPDITPPSVKDVRAETNERVVVYFSEAVSVDTAEDLRNYTINSKDGELDIIEAVVFGDDGDKVELITEAQKPSLKYEIIIEKIADNTKAKNVMKKPVKKTFFGMREDKTPPQISRTDVKVLSRNHIQVAFTDNSRLDESTVLDPRNYEITRNDKNKEEIYVQGVERLSYEDNKYKAILEVEDLTMNMNYNLRVQDVADEFGNILVKNNTVPFSVKKDDFATSTVKDYKVTKGNELEIFFTKPLDKETAEDISNYEINNSIGYPIKAVYKNEKVTLETGTMSEGKIYKLTIDGVRDQAGNRLKVNFEFKATGGEKDTTKPSLEYIYAENKNVVSVLFDEPVRFTDSGPNRTALYLKSGNREIVLYAKALSDDDMVIEFSNRQERMSVPGYGTEYTIKVDNSLKGITDASANRNAFDTKELRYYDLTIYGSDEEPYPPEVDNITQIDGKTFEVEMSTEVFIKQSSISSFNVLYTDEKNIVHFVITGARGIDGNKDYKVDISKALEDRHGEAAVNMEKGYTMFYGEYTDDDKPYIEDVIAIDRYTVEIEYNEPIGSAGSYTVRNTDDSARNKTFSVTNTKIDKNKVLLTLNNPMEGRYEYYLIINTPAKDLVGNTSEDVKGDEFYFEGSDQAPVQVPGIDHKAVESRVKELENAVADLTTEAKINTANMMLENVEEQINLLSSSVFKNELVDRKNAAKDEIRVAVVIVKIDKIVLQTLSLKNSDAVAEVRTAYDALTRALKEWVTNYEKLVNAESRLDIIAVMDKISSLPDISRIVIGDKGKVDAAREAYDDLTNKQKESVTNLPRLIEAENKLVVIVVIDKIFNLPDVSIITLDDQSKVIEAREAYNKLSNVQKDLVTNRGKLIDLEEKIKDLSKEQEKTEQEKKRIEADKQAAKIVEDRIYELPINIGLDAESKVISARGIYDKLTWDQKGYVKNYRILEEAENEIKRLIVERNIIEEENRQKEEENKRKEEENRLKEEQEQAKLAEAKKAVEDLETTVGDMEANVNAMSNRIEEMNSALNSYLTFVANPENTDEIENKNRLKAVEDNALKAIEVAANSVKEVDLALETASPLLALTREAYEKLGDREEKADLLKRINTAKTLIEEKSKSIIETKDKVSEAKVKVAKKWLTVDEFKFSEKAKADSDTPIILPLKAHAAGANFNYAEVGKMVDGKFVKENASANSLSKFIKYNRTSSENARLEFIDEPKDAISLSKVLRSIKVNRGNEDTTITLKVAITSGSKSDFKLFNISIKPMNNPVTITEVAGKIENKTEIKDETLLPKRFWE